MKAILFDLDGVLIDSFDFLWITFNETLEKFGKKSVSKREYKKKYWGRDVRSNFGKFGLGDDAIKYRRAQYISHIKEIRIFPEARKILESLSKKLKLGLVTNSRAAVVHKILEYSNLKNYFDVIVTGDDVDRGKPDPEMIIKACKSLGLDPSEVIVVGDTRSDVLAGKSAGCLVVGLNVKSDFKIKRLPELVKFIEQSLRSLNSSHFGKS
jgi:HAD superfamily hydrolase (TIGR01509 family)